MRRWRVIGLTRGMFVETVVQARDYNEAVKIASSRLLIVVQSCSLIE